MITICELKSIYDGGLVNRVVLANKHNPNAFKREQAKDVADAASAHPGMNKMSILDRNNTSKKIKESRAINSLQQDLRSLKIKG